MSVMTTSVLTPFTPLESFVGGLIIGVSVFVLLYFNGKVAGISGIIKGSFFSAKKDLLWRLFFLGGLAVGGMVVIKVLPQNTALTFHSHFLVQIIAGLCVGIGTGLSNGCTSGHGICGIARLSMRSIVATLIFMGAGFVTVYFAKLWGIL